MIALDRQRIVDENFIRRVKAEDFPMPHSATSPQDAQLDKNTFLELFDSQMTSRHLDLLARLLREKNQGFYTIASSGHEGNAALAKVFRKDDIAFLHYRSAAFVIQRAKSFANIDNIYDQILSLVAAQADPISGGRHKVFGSLPLFIPPQTSTIASHLPKAVGTAFSLTLANSLHHPTFTKLPKNSVVLCSFGDASVNHSTAQGAFNAAHWISDNYPLPLVFICEDNSLGISVPTPDDWVQKNMSSRPGLHYLTCDGRNLADVYLIAKQAEKLARQGQVVFLHLKTARLLGHAGSDIEMQYRSLAQIEAGEADDPLLHSARIICQQQWLTPGQILQSYESIRQKVHQTAERALQMPKLTSAKEIMASIVPPAAKTPATPTRPSPKNEQTQRTMAQCINQALHDVLMQYPNTIVFGEDVAKKGGVYRVTHDLQQRFGINRVFDTLLDEQSILGTAIGLAHNGFLPIPEIQFLAYVHNAVDQIRGEAATLSFFSNGQFTNPMVIRIPGLAYQKGFGGHFHNDNAIAFLREIPGLIIACPSTPKDATLLLQQCIKLANLQQRVVVFLEPIALYMTKDLIAPGDNLALSEYPGPNEKILLGELGIEGDKNSEQVIISYGNGMYLARQAAAILKAQYSIKVKLIDLRWLAPLPISAITHVTGRAKQLVIVDECRRTGSLSEELITALVENGDPLPHIQRITAQDCFIPLGSAWQYILPSAQEIVAAIVKYNKDKL